MVTELPEENATKQQDLTNERRAHGAEQCWIRNVTEVTKWDDVRPWENLMSGVERSRESGVKRERGNHTRTVDRELASERKTIHDRNVWERKRSMQPPSWQPNVRRNV
ncbi:hypothetical protein R1flu_004088 [Riccia fluitans]|uniref:Uncharacterized protein n=1 Tax=Riccia fluitans TaxID=41844 RepID=A0ABD1YQ93_9MARC